MMVGKLKFFTVHAGHLYAMSENGTTFRTTVIGNTGWVRVASRITGNEPTDSEAYLSERGMDVASTTNETITLVPAKKDEVLVLGQVPDDPPQTDEGGA